jgi:hypothetical protein
LRHAAVISGDQIDEAGSSGGSFWAYNEFATAISYLPPPAALSCSLILEMAACSASSGNEMQSAFSRDREIVVVFGE